MKHFRKLISIILILSLLCTTGIAALGTEESAQSLRFADVLPDAWYADEVAYVVDHGLMIGTSDDTFSPETRMSRAMLVTVLWRYEGSPEGYENHFTDVPAGTWYTDAVAWANAEQVVNGVGENRFSPNASVTREQMVTILHRYAQAHDIDVEARDDLGAFSDADSVSDYARDAMQWAVAAGIINGSNGRLIPQSSATRAQVAAILYRYLEEVVPVEPEKPDYTALRSAIDAAEAVGTDSYTEDSVAALQRALAAAREALNAETQADVDAAAEALRNAVNGLVVKSEEPADPTQVTVTGGTLTGRVTDDVYVYLGVPYARATERFVPTTEATWDGVLEATSYGPISPQQSFFGGNDGQDNDCLNLNIWTNGVNDGARRPVMVWYHGGGMTSGSANEAQTNGRNLAAQEDVVVVTVNHRLGAMAYLDLSAYGEKYARSGNVGVLDMIASLQWIHDNIDRFGGDPDNVTIFGQSGGGAKVLALMTSPYAKGLFHKAINQSGATNTLGPVFATEEMARRVTELTLQSLNITADNIEQLQSISFNELNTAGSAALQQVAEEFQIESPFGGSWSFEWMPYVDGDIIPTHPVLEEGFAESGRDIPLLIGSNLNEWNFSMGGVPQDDAATLAALRQTYGDRAEQILETFKTAYPNVAVGNATVVDTMLRAPLLEISRHKADQGGAPVYSYMLTYGAPQSVHGTEIPLIFDNTTAANEAMAATMRGIWAQFARTGSPAIEGLPAWDAFTRENGAVMVLDNECYLSAHHDTLIGLLLGDSEPAEPSEPTEFEVEAPGEGPASASRIASVADVPLVTLNNGVQMPQFGLGTQIQSLENGDLGILNETSRSAVTAALQSGYRHLDDAHGYLQERGVGRGIIDSGVPREEIWLTSKLWPSEYGDAYNAINQMLERLQVEYLDLVYLHHPAGDIETIVSAWQDLERAYREGKIRALGISNFDNRMEAFNAIMEQEIKPQIMQIECHPFAQRQEARALAEQYNIQVECWYPLGHGDQRLLNADTLEAIAAAHGKSVVQVIIRWHIQEGFSVIPGSTNPAHIQENIEVFDFALTEEEMAQIRAMDQGESGRYFNLNYSFMGGFFTNPLREWTGEFSR